MFFTRTIRRKLLVGGALVLGMLTVMGASVVTSLSLTRGVVHELDYAVNIAPQLADLQATVSVLFDPLLKHPSQPAAVELQREEIRGTVVAIQAVLKEFRTKWDTLPESRLIRDQRPVTQTLLNEADQSLQRIELGLQSFGNDALRPIALRRMVEETAKLQLLLQRVPNPLEGMGGMLRDARQTYRSALVVEWTCMGLAGLLFYGLLHYMYVSLFAPLSRLHQGARRVAGGDFEYRLTAATNDEMAELAAAFNQMTARFQEIKQDLDRQVREQVQQLIRSERLASVGFLAAGVAHEINNPLSAIAMAGESLEGRMEPAVGTLPAEEAAVVRRYLRMIQDEAFRCRQITERLLDFSRNRDSERVATDVSLLVGEVVTLVGCLSKFRAKQIEFPATAAVHAEVNPQAIKQVILNLVANGLEAMSPGGTLHIGLSEQVDHVLLQVRDEGCGLTVDVQENMFEPFFTSKNGQGTGLGLSISHRIVTDHGGTISAVSPGPGQGTTFTVRLPRRARQATAA